MLWNTSSNDKDMVVGIRRRRRFLLNRRRRRGSRSSWNRLTTSSSTDRSSSIPRLRTTNSISPLVISSRGLPRINGAVSAVLMEGRDERSCSGNTAQPRHLPMCFPWVDGDDFHDCHHGLADFHAHEHLLRHDDILEALFPPR